MGNSVELWCLLWVGTCLQTSEWAAWAQAVFSALAVLSAIGVVWWQFLVVKRQNTATALFFASGVLTLFGQTTAGLQQVAEGLENRFAGVADDVLPPVFCARTWVILDELGYLPFSPTGGALLFHLLSKLYEHTTVLITTNLDFAEWSAVFWRRQDDHSLAESTHASLPHCGDRQ